MSYSRYRLRLASGVRTFFPSLPMNQIWTVLARFWTRNGGPVLVPNQDEGSSAHLPPQPDEYTTFGTRHGWYSDPMVVDSAMTGICKLELQAPGSALPLVRDCADPKTTLSDA